MDLYKLFTYALLSIFFFVVYVYVSHRHIRNKNVIDYLAEDCDSNLWSSFYWIFETNGATDRFDLHVLDVTKLVKPIVSKRIRTVE